MLIADHANRPENKSGFWVQKQYGETGRCTYIVFYQGMAEFRDSISDAKQRLRDRFEKLLRDRHNKRAIASIEKPSATIPVSRSVKLIDISALITKQ